MIESRFNVLIFPYKRPWVGGPDHNQIPYHGRIIRGNDTKDEFPDRLRGRAASEKGGRYLYGGPFKCHFGHVMVDSIIRLWAFDRNRHGGVIFPALSELPPPGWFYEILEVFGVLSSDIIIVRSPTVFQELEFAEPGSTLGNGAKDWYRDCLRSLPLHITEDTPGEDLYFGRTHLIPKGRGTLMGETYFGDLLCKAGFVYVRPEEFDIHTQVSMVAKAKRIVFTEGSSIYSIELLASTDAEVFMLPRRRGVALLAPQVESKASKFFVLGDPQANLRGPNRRGKLAPDSPSVTSRPGAIFEDLVRHGLIDDLSFDMKAFRRAEEQDTSVYFSESAVGG